MKHIFTVWGHLTFYIAKKIIEVDHLNPNDCFLLLGRNYSIQTQYQAMFPNQIPFKYRVEGESQFSHRIFAGINFIKTNQNIRVFDEQIDTIVKNDTYIYYSSNLCNDYGNLIVSNKKCQGYYITEDGLGSYRQYNTDFFSGPLKRFTYWFLCLFFPRLFKYKHYFIVTDSPKFKGCIATLPFCFPLHQQYLRVIGLPFEEIHLAVVPDVLLSVDPLHLHCNMNEIRAIYTDLSNFFRKRQYKTIAFKFHPTFYADANQSIRTEITNLIYEVFQGNLVELAPQIVLENVLMSYKCDFYSDSSSVGIYAHEMGVTCYSILPIVRKYNPEYGLNISELVKRFYIDIPGEDNNAINQ